MVAWLYNAICLNIHLGQEEGEGGEENLGEGDADFDNPPPGEFIPHHISDMATYHGTGPPDGGGDGGDDSDMSGGEDDGGEEDESEEGSDTESNIMVVLEPDHVS